VGASPPLRRAPAKRASAWPQPQPCRGPSVPGSRSQLRRARRGAEPTARRWNQEVLWGCSAVILGQNTKCLSQKAQMEWANLCKERKNPPATGNGCFLGLFAANTLGMVLAESMKATGFLIRTINIFTAELKWNEKIPKLRA